jgi:hypothetical protein
LSEDIEDWTNKQAAVEEGLCSGRFEVGMLVDRMPGMLKKPFSRRDVQPLDYSVREYPKHIAIYGY